MTRHSVNLFACRDSSSTSTIGRSLEAYGIEDSIWSEYYSAQRPSRCRSFRKFCRFFNPGSRKRCFDSSEPFYHEGSDDIDTLPPYSRRQVSGFFELSEGWSSFRELPGPYSMSADIFNQGTAQELEGSSPNDSDIPTPPSNLPNSQREHLPLETAHKLDHLDMEYMMQQAYAPISRPTNFPNITCERPWYDLPLMTDEEQSQESSPISPYTPERDMSIDLHGSNSGVQDSIATPPDLLSPSSSPYATYTQLSYGVTGIHSLAAVAAPVYSASAKVSTPSLVLGEYFFNQTPNVVPDSVFSFHHTAPHQQLSHGPSLSNHPYVNPGMTQYGPKDPRVGTWEFSQNSRWVPRRFQGDNVEDASRMQLGRTDSAVREDGLAHGRIGDGQDDMSSTGRGNAKRPSPYPPAICDPCGAEFTGE